MIRRNNISSYTHKWTSTPNPIMLWEKLRRLCQLSVSGLRRTNKKLSDGVKDLMKCLLNDPLMKDTRWLINKKVKQETDLQNNNKNLGLKWYPSRYRHRTPKSLTYNNPTYNDKSQAKCFSLQSLLSLPSLSSKCVINQFGITLARKS